MEDGISNNRSLSLLWRGSVQISGRRERGNEDRGSLSSLFLFYALGVSERSVRSEGMKGS